MQDMMRQSRYNESTENIEKAFLFQYCIAEQPFNICLVVKYKLMMTEFLTALQPFLFSMI